MSSSASITSEIEIHNITRHFSHVSAADNISLNFGKIHAITGESGAGKSTLLRIIAGFEHSEAGRIVVHGRVLFDKGRGIFVPPERRRIGFIFQDNALFPHLTAKQNIVYGLGRASKVERKRRCAEMLRLVHLEPYADRYPHQLSGGQAQRVAIARALAPNPELLLMDEPFSSLDRELKRHLLSEIKRIIQALDIPTLFVSHSPREVFELADTISIMKEGRILQSDTPQAIYEKPLNCYVASFFGDANFLHSVEKKDRITLIRPENIRIQAEKDRAMYTSSEVAGRSGEHTQKNKGQIGHIMLRARILERHYYGNRSLYWVECDEIPGFVSKILQVSSRNTILSPALDQKSDSQAENPLHESDLVDRGDSQLPLNIVPIQEAKSTPLETGDSVYLVINPKHFVHIEH